jgi:hypothetical protein
MFFNHAHLGKTIPISHSEDCAGRQPNATCWPERPHVKSADEWDMGLVLPDTKLFNQNVACAIIDTVMTEGTNKHE